MLCKTSDLAWRTGLFGHWGLQAYLGRQNNSNTGIPYCDHTDLSFPLFRILLIQKTPARRCKKYPVLTGLNRRKALLPPRTRCTAVLPSAGFDKTQSSAPDCKGQVWEQDTQVLTVTSPHGWLQHTCKQGAGAMQRHLLAKPSTESEVLSGNGLKSWSHRPTKTSMEWQGQSLQENPADPSLSGSFPLSLNVSVFLNKRNCANF